MLVDITDEINWMEVYFIDITISCLTLEHYDIETT